MGLLSDDQSMKRVPEIDVEREISNDPFVTKEEEVYCSSVMENGTYHRGLFAGLLRIEAWLDKKVGVESEAIERKRPEDRKPIKWYEELNMAFLWASGTMNLHAACTTNYLL